MIDFEICIGIWERGKERKEASQLLPFYSVTPPGLFEFDASHKGRIVNSNTSRDGQDNGFKADFGAGQECVHE